MSVPSAVVYTAPRRQHLRRLYGLLPTGATAEPKDTPVGIPSPRIPNDGELAEYRPGMDSVFCYKVVHPQSPPSIFRWYPIYTMQRMYRIERFTFDAETWNT